MKNILVLLLLVITITFSYAQDPCDSVSYTINTIGTDLILEGSDSNWTWTACDENTCYSSYGQYTTFNQFTVNDTIKLCYDNTICYDCDSLVFSGGNWIILGGVVGIKEYSIKQNNKIYNIYGREVFYLKPNTIYIKNSKTFIIFK